MFVQEMYACENSKSPRVWNKTHEHEPWNIGRSSRRKLLPREMGAATSSTEAVLESIPGAH